MKKTKKKVTQQPVGGKVSRRNAIQSVLGLAGTGLLLPLSSYAEKPSPTHFKEGEVRITKLETFLVKPRWIFLKIHTDAGVVGLGEPLLEGRALTIQTAIKELEPYLIGKDPRRVVHHWQAIYRHAFYRGGPILTSALSGIDHALWDIKGKLLGVPVYELFGGPTRDRVRIYGRASNAEDMKKRKQEGYTVIKTGVAKKQPARIVENPAFIQYAADNFASLREAGGPEMDIGIDFHGAISPQTAKVLIKELEQYQPMFVEEPCQAQNVDVMAEIARGTHLPIATGERIFTKWGFREILEKGAAEAYYAAIAPHNPMGPISLACGLHLAASVPNFLVQEQVTLGEGYLKNPFKLESDGTVLIPKGPGLGIELDEDALEDKIGHDWTNPQSYDPRDGSVVDW